VLDKRYVLGAIVIIGLIALAALWPEKKVFSQQKIL